MKKEIELMLSKMAEYDRKADAEWQKVEKTATHSKENDDACQAWNYWTGKINGIEAALEIMGYKVSRVAENEFWAEVA